MLNFFLAILDFLLQPRPKRKPVIRLYSYPTPVISGPHLIQALRKTGWKPTFKYPLTPGSGSATKAA
jgi:hypothetical protein